jgi:DNA modification methylase
MATSNQIYDMDARGLYHLFRDSDQKIDCVITDPPYGVDFQSNFAETAKGKEKTRKIAGDDDLESALSLFNIVMTNSILPYLADEVDLYLFTSWSVAHHWKDLMSYFSDLDLKMEIIWAKGWPGLGDLTSNWGCGYETILYYKKGRRPVGHRRSAILHFDSDINAEIDRTREHLERLLIFRDGGELTHYETGVVSIDKPATSKHVHPTEKPVALIEQLIKMSSQPGDLIVDPFSGSGSTSLAAQRLGRNSIACEIDPEYVEIGRARLTQESGSLF